MPDVLPQQKLLLELILKSGDIKVPQSDDGSMLYRTLNECVDLGWVSLTKVDGKVEAAVRRRGRRLV